MPIYEYRCNQWGTISEYFVGMGSKDETLNCKQWRSSHLEKMLSVSHSLKSEKRVPGHICCEIEERCSTPPCSANGNCRKD